MKSNNTVIYFDGGEDYKGQFELTEAMRKKWHGKAFENGHDGYLTGYRYSDGRKDSVLVYFKTKPSEEEIAKRRKNGFLSARWAYLFSVTRYEIRFTLNIAETFDNNGERINHGYCYEPCYSRKESLFV